MIELFNKILLSNLVLTRGKRFIIKFFVCSLRGKNTEEKGGREMLLGSYPRIFNGKFFVLPRPLFREIAKESCIIAIPARSAEKCIVLFPLSFINSIGGIGDFRFLCGVNFGQNREIIVPKTIKRKISEYFKIKKGEKLVFVGCVNRIEIWKKEDWEKIQREYSYEKVLERVFYSEGKRGRDF